MFSVPTCPAISHWFSTRLRSNRCWRPIRRIAGHAEQGFENKARQTDKAALAGSTAVSKST
jgi:hypothetical protein